MAALGEGENEVYVSPHIETLLGFTQQEWLDDPFLWYHQLHPDDRELWNQEFANGCRRGGPFRAECRFLTRDGQVIWVHGEARVIRDELGRPLYLQGIAFDITESKRAQEILLKSSVEQAKFAQQLDIARRVQTSILPTELHAEGLEIAAVMVPAEDVGGDYYDVLPFKGGCYIGVGDVSGHGLDAGLVMMMVQSAVSGLVRANPTATPTRIVCAVNEVIYDNVRNRMHHDDHVTFSLLRYTSDGCVKFAGAHEFILVYRQAYRGIEVIWTRGTWLGAIPDISPATIEQTLRLEPGDVMVLYTDGVTEAMNAEGLQFDLEPLGKAIVAAAPQGPKAIVERVLADIRAFSNVQSDDISIVAARYAGAGQKQESTE
jgi:sigma-B regulation protein RsbU (phosphoserine phosphatase)